MNSNILEGSPVTWKAAPDLATHFSTNPISPKNIKPKHCTAGVLTWVRDLRGEEAGIGFS